MLNINNFDITDLNRNADEDLIFKLKLKEVKLILKEIDRANAYEII